jgi:hypothetical protein
MDIAHNIEAALVFAFIGIAVFVLSFVLIDRLTPHSLEIVRRKYGLAVLVGALRRHLYHHRGRGALDRVDRALSVDPAGRRVRADL